MRKKIVAGNWKMNMDLAEGLKFAGSIENTLRKTLQIRRWLFYVRHLYIWQVQLKFLNMERSPLELRTVLQKHRELIRVKSQHG